MKTNRLKKIIARGMPLFLFLAMVWTGLIRKGLGGSGYDAGGDSCCAEAAPLAGLQGFMNDYDFTWVNGNTQEQDFPMAGKVLLAGTAF